MDPLSITASLIAVIQVTTSIVQICYDYRSGVVSASREVIQISDQLNALTEVLEALLRLVESSKSDDLKRFCTVQDLAKDGGTLQACLREMERLKGKLEPETGWRKLRSSLVWPLKEGEMIKALEALERFKSTLQLALSTDQACVSTFQVRGYVLI